MRDLEGKVALVTGGARGVGKVIARGFAERGARVVINYFHSHERAKETKAELERGGGEVAIIRASVAQRKQVDAMFAEIERTYGHLDILVNNAAAGVFLPVEAIEEEHFARAFDTNLKGAFWCCRAAQPLMAKRGGGTIVNVSSIGAGLVPANYLVVGTSKAALEALTRYLAVEFASSGIRVNTASATMVEGDVAKLFPGYESMRQASIDHTPLGRIATAEDLAGVVMFLTSQQSSWVNGQTILADGGLSLNHVALSPARETVTDTAARPDATSVRETSVPDTDDIAIVGMGLAVPGASSPEEFWRILMERPELFSRVPADRWDYRSFVSPDPAAEDKTYQSRSAFITESNPVAPENETARRGASGEFTTEWLRHSLVQSLQRVKHTNADRWSFIVGYTADGSQHLEEAMVLAGALERLERALADANGAAAEKSAVFEEIREVLRGRYWRGAGDRGAFLPHHVGARAMAGILPDATELMMVDTACSSSLYAVDIGVKGLLMGKHDIAVCGGSFALAPRGSVLFAKLHGLSESGEVRPLDKSCDGVLFSDGAGVVILKKLTRALADGDQVLALVRGFGSSSDGRGKAIYAPSAAGQRLAITRALADAELDANRIEWVVAHATGTPAGDLAEVTTLRETMASDHPVYVTSNKSLIGHTGWAAGVASLIQVLLGLQHDTIPPQHRFDEPQAGFDIQNSPLRVPTAPVKWLKKDGAPRVASVSGFGFGGTNAHVIVEEYVRGTGKAARPRQWNDRLALVGWSAHVPGFASRSQLEAWVSNPAAPKPQLTFGDVYPLPPFEKARMPKGTLRAIDRCQLMVLECAHELRSQLLDFWDANTATIGVVMGHMGPTRNAALYADRCYLDDIDAAVRTSSIGSHPIAQQALEGLRAETCRLVIPSNENSFPGMMPNVIPARIANYFDLKGLNLTVDTGPTSTLSALEIAGRYLRSGELTMALVGGVNGNTLPEISHLLPDATVPLAEGAFLFALTTETIADRAGLTVLAHIETDPANGFTPGSVIECGARSDPNYLGAEGGRALLAALQSGPISTDVVCRDIDPNRVARLRVHRSRDSVAAEDQTKKIPESFVSATESAPGTALEVQRHEAFFKAYDAPRVRAEIPFLADGTVVLTDRPELVKSLGTLPRNTLVISTTPLSEAREGWVHATDLEGSAIAAVIQRADIEISHLRVITDLGTSDGVDSSLWRERPSLVALHDLTFLVLKHAFDRLSAGGSSVVGVFLNALAAGTLHPFGGLFSGLFKSAALELPECVVAGTFTTETDLAAAVRQAASETALGQYLPVVLHDGGTRKTLFVREAAATVPDDLGAQIGPESTVVAVGGARGITAELMTAIARHFRPTLYLIGSNPLEQYPRELFAESDEAFAKRRHTYIRDQKTQHPGKALGTIVKEFERMAEARAAQANIDAMQQHAGTDRVRYIACDITDRESLAAVMKSIVDRHGRIDLLVNAPGLNRAASLTVKTLKDFRAVRDLKLRGYQNLKWALRDTPPRTWCNFGSFIGLTGQLGETDYASANDFLATAAMFGRATGADECTIGWTLWKSVGLGANPVTRAFLEKSRQFTPMCTATGVHHFIREVNATNRAASVVMFGDAERAAITHHFADYLAVAAKEPDALPAGTFYIGRTVERTAEEILIERVFDLTTDAYLNDHLVNGYPTLPGTFVPELAAEAALQLRPDLTVIGFEDVVFQHFLRVYDRGRPNMKRIHARVLHAGSDQTVIQVRVLTDIVGPTGRVLQKDKLHFELKAILARTYPEAPVWDRWSSAGEEFVTDPYHVPSAPVLLKGPFVSTRQTCSHPLGRTAMFDLKLERRDPVFSQFVVPTILLDGLARVAVLTYVNGEYIPLAAPASIRRIDIYEAGNDGQLAERYRDIRLYATPRDLSLQDRSKGNRFVAARPDGRMIMQMKDVTGVVIGYVHRHTGAYASPEEIRGRELAGDALAAAGA